MFYVLFWGEKLYFHLIHKVMTQKLKTIADGD